MFTGIVTDIGEIVGLAPTAQGQLHRLRIACGYDRTTIADGASIACNGVCLTVVASGTDAGRTWFDVDAAAETLALTTAKRWAVGTKLNLERALKIGDELGGHIVAGHADGIATILSRDDLPDMARIRTVHHARARAFHSTQRLGDVGRRLVDGERGGGYRIFGSDHSAYVERDDAFPLACGQRGQYRSRPDGALCGATVGDEVSVMTGLARFR